MEHQPFENWILSGQPLLSHQSDELDSHLSICQHCQAVKAGIMGVENLFNTTGFESPSPGFTNRFKYLAALREEESKRIQSYFFLGYLLAATTLISIGYISILFLTQSPGEIISKLMDNTIKIVINLDFLLSSFQSLIGFIPWPVGLLFVVSGAGFLVLLTSGWIISVLKVASQGVNVNE